MNPKIVIVGMEAFFQGAEGLDAFDRAIFDGVRHAAERPADPGKRRIRAGTRSEPKEGYCRLPAESDRCGGALSWMKIVFDGLLRDGPAQAALNDLALIVLSDLDLSPLQDVPGRFFTEDSVSSALQRAQALLYGEEVRGVVIGAVHRLDPQEDSRQTEPVVPGRNPDGASGHDGNGNGWSPGEGAAAVFLKRADRAEEDGDRVFAVIEGFGREAGQPAPAGQPAGEQIANVCREAFAAGGVSPAEVGYLEISGEGIEGLSQSRIRSLAEAYRTDAGQWTCGLGSVSASLGAPSPATGLAGLIKAALCLYHRYIPAVPGWTGPRDPQAWEGSPFYVPADSRPWFLDRSTTRRRAAVHSEETAGLAHLILAEQAGHHPRKSRYLSLVAPYCFPVAADDPEDLVRQLNALKQNIETGSGLAPAAGRNLAAFQDRSGAAHALVIVGHRREELLKEIDFLLKGVPAAFQNRTDLKTPRGSFFTPNPLGQGGKLAFVYPGVGSAYVGLGHAIFHLFPETYDRFFSEISPDMGRLLKERDLYPRRLAPLTEDEIWKLELGLRRDIMAISESGMGFFALYTMVLKDCFKVSPSCALGYSMGEPGMMAALGAWQAPGQLADKFQGSLTFRERLSGRLAAVRELWNLGEGGPGSGEKIWGTYTLQATPSRVREAIEREKRVYLTIINAPDEVVIAGDPESCLRVVREIGCKHYPLGLDLAIHCEPVRSEYDRLVDLHTLPVRENPGIRFYSSSCYQAIPFRSKAIAHSIAQAFCETVDFPRLVNQAYEDGARIFIEVGSRKFCSNLIEKILKGRDHAVMATNVKGTTDQAAIVRVLAQLVSHRVPVDLTPLF